MVISSVSMSLPHWIGSGGSGGEGSSLFFGGGKFFASDLYIPRCHPDGDVVVLSGHSLKPLITDSGSSGWSVSLLGGIFDVR